MIGRTWADQYASSEVARALVMAALQNHTPESIIETGLRVEELLKNFRRDYQVPEKRELGGLLVGPRVVSVNDWELALHLEQIRNKAMMELAARFAGDSPLLALAAIGATADKAPDWLHEALPEVAFRSLAVQEVRERQLQEAVKRLKPLADKMVRVKDGGAEGGRKGAIRRRKDGISPDAVRNAAVAFGWPTGRADITKRLARKFDCTPDHISKILRKPISVP